MQGLVSVHPLSVDTQQWLSTGLEKESFCHCLLTCTHTLASSLPALFLFCNPQLQHLLLSMLLDTSSLTGLWLSAHMFPPLQVLTKRKCFHCSSGEQGRKINQCFGLLYLASNFEVSQTWTSPIGSPREYCTLETPPQSGGIMPHTGAIVVISSIKKSH